MKVNYLFNIKDKLIFNTSIILMPDKPENLEVLIIIQFNLIQLKIQKYSF